MRYAGILLVFACAATQLLAEDKTEGPTNEKAQKTYKEALEYQHKHMTESALESFKNADKQDEGHCVACQKKMIEYGVELRDWKTAEAAAGEFVAEAHGETATALAYYQFGVVLMREGVDKRKDELFARRRWRRRQSSRPRSMPTDLRSHILNRTMPQKRSLSSL